MGFDRHRCNQIVHCQRANYPYLREDLAAKVVGTIMAKRRQKVHITADFKPAIEKCSVPLEQQRAYLQVAADYFNQKGAIVHNGSSIGIYKRSRLTLAKHKPWHRASK